MKDVKPILITKITGNGWDDYLDDIDHFNSTLEKVSEDYHIIFIPYSGKYIDFSVFYEKDFNDVKYEELKNIITELINHD